MRGTAPLLRAVTCMGWHTWSGNIGSDVRPVSWQQPRVASSTSSSSRSHTGTGSQRLMSMYCASCGGATCTKRCVVEGQCG